MSSRRSAGRVWIVAVCAMITAALGAAVGARLVITRPVGEPHAVEVSEAEFGAPLTGATVLALGEATHGNAEFQRLRQQVLAKLPDTRAIVLEEDYGTVARANAFAQGGEGTPEQAARQLGFAINRTQEVADLLAWLRRQNADRTAEQRIELIGMDVQRYEASKELALRELAASDAGLADRLGRELAGLTDRPSGPDGDTGRAGEAVQELIKALKQNGSTSVAQNAAAALQQGLRLDSAGSDYARLRAEIMFDNLRRTVAEQHTRGNRHTLVVGQNGHLDKTSAAFGHADLGELAAREWGQKYRVIGTEFVRSTFVSGERERRWTVTMNNPTPLRGMFTGTRIGLLQFDRVGPANRERLNRPVRMASAGENFKQWQAYIRPLNSVRMVPAGSYDALIMVDRATPVTPL